MPESEKDKLEENIQNSNFYRTAIFVLTTIKNAYKSVFKKVNYYKGGKTFPLPSGSVAGPED